MISNSLVTNLLVTSILSKLASRPQPILRSVLLQPDVVFQPSVRGLFTAIASLRQKLDNVMPTLAGADEAICLAKKFLEERVDTERKVSREKRKDSTGSVSSTISHLGQEANRHRSSLTAAFSSMFRKKTGNVTITTNSTSSTSSTPSPKAKTNLNSSAPASMMDSNNLLGKNSLKKEVWMDLDLNIHGTKFFFYLF